MSKWIKKLAEAYSEVNESKFLIPEEIPTQERTAFMGAAAAAHKAGQSHFNFGGKKHKVTMQPSTARAIADQKESVDEASAHYTQTVAQHLAKKDGHDYHNLPVYTLGGPHQQGYTKKAKDALAGGKYKSGIHDSVDEAVEQVDEISRSMTPMRNRFGSSVDSKKWNIYKKHMKTHNLDEPTVHMIHQNPDEPESKRMMKNPKYAKAVDMYKNSMKESVDLDKTNADKAVAHDCATHVKHESWGYGECIAGEHTIIETSEGQGYVSHYDVMFEHGIEQNVDVKDLTVLQEMSHSHPKKKKENVEVEMNPKKDKKGAKGVDTDVQSAAESRWPIYARIQEKSADRAKHYAKSTPPEAWDEKEKNNKGAMDMRKDMKADSPDEAPYKEKDGHDDASKAGRVGPNAKHRQNDNKQGDKKVINPVSGVVTKEK